MRSRSSFENVFKVGAVARCHQKWYDQMKSCFTDQTRPIPVMLVGTKTDLITNPMTIRQLAEKKEKAVTYMEVIFGTEDEFQSQEVAKKIGAFATVQCSAKTQENLKKVFDMAINVPVNRWVDIQYVLEYRHPKETSCCVVQTDVTCLQLTKPNFTFVKVEVSDIKELFVEKAVSLLVSTI